jgi:hypothetical protein
MGRPKGSKNLTPEERAERLRVYNAQKLPPHRPTTWKPEYNQAIIDWFEDAALHPFREVVDNHGRIQLVPKRCPTLEGFAHSIGTVPQVLERWAEEENKDKYPGFSESHSRALKLQKDFLLATAQSGAADSRFTMFMLKNNHGMRDTTDITNDGGKFEPPVIINPGKDLTI